MVRRASATQRSQRICGLRELQPASSNTQGDRSGAGLYGRSPHAAARDRTGPQASWIVTLVMATGAFGRSRALRGADTILSTTSMPFVTSPNSV